MNKFLDFAEFTHWLLRWPPFWVELVPIAYQLRSLVVWHRQSFCWNGYSLEKLCASDPAISDSDSNSGQRKQSHLPKNNNYWKESYMWYNEWFMIANEQISQFCRVQSLALKVTALLSVACSDRITIEFFALLRSSSILCNSSKKNIKTTWLSD